MEAVKIQVQHLLAGSEFSRTGGFGSGSGSTNGNGITEADGREFDFDEE